MFAVAGQMSLAYDEAIYVGPLRLLDYANNSVERDENVKIVLGMSSS